MNAVKSISPSDFFKEWKKTVFVDVRSPKEFEQGHIPGAINLPLFCNDERATVGTLYKTKGSEKAIMKGLEIVGPKMQSFVKVAKQVAIDNKLLVHCWRGGQRSASMAWLFQTAGLETKTLEGGYKACRKYMKEQLSKSDNLIILGGMTGSGKTEVLHHLGQLGEQIVDLEGLANHKGSAFGGIGQKEQPSTEQFENILFEKWMSLDKSRTVWLEDESKAIGKVKIPDELFLKMRECPVLELIMDKEMRVNRIAREYAKLDVKELGKAIYRIQKRLGGLHVKQSITAIEKQDFESAIRLILNYYDKTYKTGLSFRNNSSRYPIVLQKDLPDINAKKIIAQAHKLSLIN